MLADSSPPRVIASPTPATSDRSFDCGGSVGAITASMPTERCTPRTRPQKCVATQLAIEDKAAMTNIANVSIISNSSCRLMTGSGTMVRIVTIPVVNNPTRCREHGPARRLDEQRVKVVRIDDRESAAGEHRRAARM